MSTANAPTAALSRAMDTILLFFFFKEHADYVCFYRQGCRHPGALGAHLLELDKRERRGEREVQHGERQKMENGFTGFVKLRSKKKKKCLSTSTRL